MTVLTSPKSRTVLALRIAGILCWIWAVVLLFCSVLGLFPRPEFEFLRRTSFVFAVALALFAILYGIAAIGLRRRHFMASVLAMFLAVGYCLLIALAHWPDLLVGVPLNLSIAGFTAVGWVQLARHRVGVSV